MYRVFLSHSRRDNAAAQATFRWLTDNEPGLTGEIFLDINPQTGFAPGVRWKSELTRAVDTCEAVICLISPRWEASGECVAEFRPAEYLNKRFFCSSWSRRSFPCHGRLPLMAGPDILAFDVVCQGDHEHEPEAV
jgi:hypothetical protein